MNILYYNYIRIIISYIVFGIYMLKSSGEEYSLAATTTCRTFGNYLKMLFFKIVRRDISIRIFKCKLIIDMYRN